MGLYSICIGAFRVILRDIIVALIVFISLNFEIVKMLTSSAVSIPLIPIRKVVRQP